MKKIKAPYQDPETHEWRYRGKWWNAYPSEELEKDEAAYDMYWDQEFHRRGDEA